MRMNNSWDPMINKTLDEKEPREGTGVHKYQLFTAQREEGFSEVLLAPAAFP
jgi:hypothetical protein